MPAPVIAEGSADAQVEWFESRIRPVLVGHCYECHNSSDVAEGGLALDHRQGLLAGGDSGSAIDADDPASSLLLKAIRHDADVSPMPQGAGPLDQEVVADFQRWIADGAHDPRDEPPSADALAKMNDWPGVLEQRSRWWSFQPIADPPIPEPTGATSPESVPSHPVDRWIQLRLDEANLAAAPRASDEVLLRRLSYALTGLPPDAESLAWLSEPLDQQRFTLLVDQLLDSPHFGEHWARHWMDWIRYAESHGSEGDPPIPHAWQFRDYLIRALNADVPYDLLVREQIAGDLLDSPRLNQRLGINESAIGPAHLRMVYHGFSPTDAMEEKIRFTDDQINVVSKAFLGLTVSCARCHHHKFDPVSQHDYYAWFGIFGSTRPGIVDANIPQRQTANRAELERLKGAIRKQLAADWLDHLAAWDDTRDLAPWLPPALKQAADDKQHPLHQLAQLAGLETDDGQRFQQRLHEIVSKWQGPRSDDAQPAEPPSWAWGAAMPDSATWYAAGNGSVDTPAAAGQFAIASDGDTALSAILPAGYYSHLLSTKHRGVLSTPRLQLDGPLELWLQVAGDGRALARYVVQNYPRSGTIYPVRELDDGRWRWHRFDLEYWQGDEIHVELTTAGESPVLAKDQPRSWFGLRQARLVPKGTGRPAELAGEHAAPLLMPLVGLPPHELPDSLDQLQRHIATVLRDAIRRWAEQEIDDAQSLLLDRSCASGLLPNRLDLSDSLQALLRQYRQLEADIPAPTRVPGVWEADAADAPLLVRGQHSQPADPVPRRFLEVIDASPYQSDHSGRLQLADDLVGDDNPLAARVAVNRIWLALFGEGLVRTPDNFGLTGQTPTHPELLDHLATRFRQQGWSIKWLVRDLVTSQAWQRDSRPSEPARKRDPENQLLSHANLRRLAAEPLRDTLLALSGRLDASLYGPPAGRQNDHPRRSVYTTVHRNSLNPFLDTFDAPVPFATKGRRDATNVPAQSLTMLNDPFVADCARGWVRQLADLASNERVEAMFRQALGRLPSKAQRQRSLQLVDDLRSSYQHAERQRQALQDHIVESRRRIDRIEKPVRQSLRLAARQGPPDQPAPPDQRIDGAQRQPAAPLLHWDFRHGADEQQSGLASHLEGSAHIAGGALLLDGNGYLASDPLPRDVQQRTLQALVQLDDLQQRGGGLVSIQSLDGHRFDAIVYGERQPQHWLAGSDHFRRTQDFGGPDEQQATDQPVLVTIVWHADGMVRGYRNGQPYGRPYRTAPAVTFPAGRSQLLLGLRHGSPGGNRLLRGRLLAAWLYDQALDKRQVAQLATEVTGVLTAEQVAEALAPQQRDEVQRLRAQIAADQQQLARLGPPADADQAWIELGHAILNLKEFLYVR